MTELAKYTDESLTKKEASRKREISGEKVYRNWFATCVQWVSDFNALHGDHHTDHSLLHTQAKSTKTSSVQGSEESKRVFVVPADDIFTRCPVSKEVFETFWDQEEGEFMFRNAAKVLVTQAADENIFKISQPTSHQSVKYCILHKLLVLDGLIANGRADTLRHATARYLSTGTVVAKDKVAELVAAVGNDDNQDDIFVILSN
jgi:hypothetical protein